MTFVIWRTGCRAQWRSVLRLLRRCPLPNRNFKEVIESLHLTAQSNAVEFAVADAHALAACRN
jgi:hypothetical protein